MGKDQKGKELGRGYSQRPDGRYMGRAQVNGHSIILYDWNLKELKKRLPIEIDKERRKYLLPNPDGSSITLNEWFDEWFTKYKEPILKGGHNKSYKNRFLNYYGKRLGNKYLNDIQQMHVQAVIAELVEEGKKPRSIREVTGTFRQCVEAALANGVMQHNPVLGVVIPSGEKVRRRILSTKEQQILLDFLDKTKNWYTEMIQFMLLTGMRIGEIGGLQWKDIDFNEEYIHVERSLTYVEDVKGMKLAFTSPKTENSVRKIPFFGETKSVLESQSHKVERRRKELGRKWRLTKEFGELIFVTSLGSPVSRHAAERAFKRISEEINLMLYMEAPGQIFFENIYPHVLRHTFATRCFEKGMKPRTVQEIMGHANYTTTVSYTHVLDDIKKIEAKRIGNFLENEGGNEEVDYESLLGIL